MVKRKGEGGEGNRAARRKVKFGTVETSEPPEVFDDGEDMLQDEKEPAQRKMGDKVGTEQQINDYDDDVDEDVQVERMTSEIAGEEDEGDEQFNEVGETIEPFNLRNEREEGYFDVNGNFVWRKQDEEPDAWLAGLDDQAMEEAIGTAQRAQTRKNQAEEETPDDPLSLMGSEALLSMLLQLLEPGETVLRALKRYGSDGSARGAGQARKQRPLTGQPQPKPKAKPEADKGAPGTKTPFEHLTEIADNLLQNGQVDIYQQKREDIEEQLENMAARREREERQQQQQQQAPPPAHSYFGNPGGTEAEESEQPGAADTVFFEYRGKDGNVHGPYGLSQMKYWKEQGYFAGDSQVVLRQVDPAAVPESAGASGASGVGVADELMADLDDDEDEDGPSDIPDQAKQRAADTLNGPDQGWVSSEEIQFDAY